MKFRNPLILLLPWCVAFFSCTNQVDKELFNGEIHDIDAKNTIDKDVIAKHVPLEGDYTGTIAVYDSLLVCWEPTYQDYLFNVFNVDTGKEIGYFCPKGQGPDEFANANFIYQFLRRNNDVVALFDGDWQSWAFWNLTKSCQTGKTVYDTIVSHRSVSNLFFFYLPDGDILHVIPSQGAELHETTMPYCEQQHLYNDQKIRKIPIYKRESLHGEWAERPVSRFFNTWDALKPDGTKLVQAMSYLPQLNIIDITTGRVTGYREKGGSDYSLLQKQTKKVTRYYTSVQADDRYIYAAYWGKESWEDRPGSSLPTFNLIHVFDWEGHLLYRLHTDQSFYINWLDTVRNRLYTRDWNTDEIYYLDLNELER